MEEMLWPVESSRTYIQEAYCLHSFIYGMMYFVFFFKNKGTKSSKRGYILFEKVGFDICSFPNNWDRVINELGDGTKIEFPVKMYPYLGWSRRNYTLNGNTVVPKLIYI